MQPIEKGEIMHSSTINDSRRATWIVLRAAALLTTGWLATAGTAQAAATLDQVQKSSKLTIGYFPNAQPFSSTDASGKPSGYAIALCQKVADAVKTDLRLAALTVDFVPLPGTGDDRLSAVQEGRIDLLCGAVPTLARRKVLDFSIAIFASGTSVVVRADAPARLVQALSGRESPDQPYWRGGQGQAPERKSFAVVGGSALERALLDRLLELHIAVDVVKVKDLPEGLELVRTGGAAAFFGDRALLLAAAKSSPKSGELVVIDRIFRREPVALALRRSNDDFRLLIDKTLSQLYRSNEIAPLYATYFGKPDQNARIFFEVMALPEE
jgi:ABC-type amino acid transport substrate-binding protein